MSVDFNVYLLPAAESVQTQSIEYRGSCLVCMRCIRRQGLYRTTGSQCFTWSWKDKSVITWAAACSTHVAVVGWLTTEDNVTVSCSSQVAIIWRLTPAVVRRFVRQAGELWDIFPRRLCILNGWAFDVSASVRSDSRKTASHFQNSGWTFNRAQH